MDKLDDLTGILLGVDYKKQFWRRLALTSLFLLAYFLFQHVALVFFTAVMALATLESYVKYSKGQK